MENFICIYKKYTFNIQVRKSPICNRKYNSIKTIAFYNIKGGVGKTTSVINFACLLAKQHLSVLIWDADAQGGTSFFFNTHHQNNHKYKKLFSGDCSIYETIQQSDVYHIDIISNDSFFSDATVQQSYGMSKVNYLNGDTMKKIVETVADDYDVCLIDCPPGKSILHDNIFKTTDLILAPTIPSALSMNCLHMLLQDITHTSVAVFSFFNMVQIRKKIHKLFIEIENQYYLQHYIPFYAEIENITFNKQSIFHTIKESKSLIFYENVWVEICSKLGWLTLTIQKSKVVPLSQNTTSTYRNVAFDTTNHQYTDVTAANGNMYVAQAYYSM